MGSRPASSPHGTSFKRHQSAANGALNGPVTLARVTDVPETRYIRSGDLRLAIQVCDGPGPDVLLIAIGQVPIDLMWDDPLLARGLRHLAAHTRLITCDLRGWGSSEQISLPLPAVQAWMDDIKAVLDAVGSDRAALVANSVLVPPALLFAATHPDRVSSLALVNGFARYEQADGYPFGMPTETLDTGIDWYCDTLGTGPTTELMCPSRAADPLFRLWAMRSERLSFGPGGETRAITNLFMRSDVRGVLANVAAPCLVLHRTDDQFVRREHAVYLKEHLPDAELVDFPGADHLWSSGDVEGIFSTIAAFVTGAKGATGAGDRVLATIVFTDIVDSTERVGALGDREWRLALERYEGLAARHVEGFRGRVVKSTGDGTLAMFDGPARAIECACALRDAASGIGLPIRAGVHTGEVELMGDDIGGIAVHIGARVAALAERDEVLVSASVPPLVAGSGIRFEDRGTHRLKGVPEPWALLAVLA